MVDEFDDINFNFLLQGEHGQKGFSLYVELTAIINNGIRDHANFGRIGIANYFLDEIVRIVDKEKVDLGDSVDKIRDAMHSRMYKFSLDCARTYFEYGVMPLAMAWLDEAGKYAELLGIDKDKVIGIRDYYERIGT